MVRGYARRSKMVPPGYRPGRGESKAPPLLRPSALPTAMDVDIGLKDLKLFISMDYGTKTLALSWRIAKPDEPPLPTNVHDVHFSERDYYAPQAVAWTENGFFYWGYDVEKALKTKKIKQEDVIELWKLLLYENHQSSDLFKHVEEQLADHTLEDLLSTHLKAIIDEAKTYLKNSQSLDYTAKEIEQLPIELFLSVPQMWSPNANLKMTDAAKAAGIERVEVVYEPQCAAAYYTHNIKDRLPRQLEIGDVLLIADIGGGTGDFVSYEYRHDIEKGAKVGLRTVGDASGAACGSEFVNQNFITWLKKQPKDFEGQCHNMGLTPTACIRQASAAFESIKVSFTMPTVDSEYVTIRGAQGAKTKVWDIELKSDNIVSFFKPVFQQIMDCIDEQLTDHTKVLLIPGGFGRSDYLLEKLKDKYEPQGLKILGQANAVVGAYQPVSRGALLRYQDIQDRGIPSKHAFGVAQVEVYDPVLHAGSIAEIDPYDGETMNVYERWLPIMKRGDLKVPGQPFTTEKWQHAIISVDDEQFDVQTYWTSLNIQEHDSIRLGKDANSPLKPGIKLYRKLIMDITDLEALGFDPIESDSGMVYEFYYRLVMECNGANVSVKWQIAQPGTQPYDEDGKPRSSQFEFAKDQVFELCAESHNPFPRISPK